MSGPPWGPPLLATVLYIKLTVQFTVYAKENLILYEILIKIFWNFQNFQYNFQHVLLRFVNTH